MGRKLGMVVHIFSVSIRETETGGPLLVPGQLKLHSKTFLEIKK